MASLAGVSGSTCSTLLRLVRHPGDRRKPSRWRAGTYNIRNPTSLRAKQLEVTESLQKYTLRIITQLLVVMSILSRGALTLQKIFGPLDGASSTTAPGPQDRGRCLSLRRRGAPRQRRSSFRSRSSTASARPPRRWRERWRTSRKPWRRTPWSRRALALAVTI